MWIFTNRAFLSIVAPKPGGEVDPATHLMVRARTKGDLERVFGKRTKVLVNKGTDYRFRAFVTRKRVAGVLAREASAIAYTNFKDSVADQQRHDAYMRVWSVMEGDEPPAAIQRVAGGRAGGASGGTT